MVQHSKIQWTEHTFNPWVGCQKVSEGCANCYAEVSRPANAARSKGLELWGPPSRATRQRTSAAVWREPLKWNRRAEKAGTAELVFCASQADVFEDARVVEAWRTELFQLIEATPYLTWQLLTKRPANLRAMLPSAWLRNPLPNVWLGTTVESQETAEARIPELLRAPAVVRFLSCEPLISAVDLDPPRCQYCSDGGEIMDEDPPWCVRCDSEAVFGHWLDACASPSQPGINWVIVGGESGPRARHFDLSWARSIVEQCKDASVPVFVKQLGSNPVLSPGRISLPVLDSHGGDITEWPEDLRIRQMPERRAPSSELHKLVDGISALLKGTP